MKQSWDWLPGSGCGRSWVLQVGVNGTAIAIKTCEALWTLVPLAVRYYALCDAPVVDYSISHPYHAAAMYVVVYDILVKLD